MSNNNRYDTLSMATTDLGKRGYKAEFTLKPDRLLLREKDKSYGPHDFEVDEYHRFEGISNPSDMSIVYAITTNDGLKGTLIEAYGAYSEKGSAEMVKKMDIRALED